VKHRNATCTWYALLLGLAFTAGSAQATLIRYESEIHTGNNIISFHNHTTSGLNITRIEVQLGANMVFDTNGSGLDGLAIALASTGTSNGYTVGHFGTSWTANSTASQVGLVGVLSSLVVDGSRTATFNFTDFNPGEAWGLYVDLDTLNNSREDPAGSDMNGVLVRVFFQGVATPLTSSCSDPAYTPGVDECYPSTFGGNKKSFPSSNSATVVAVATPEPASFVLYGAGLIGLGLLRRSRS
jgi:hypothetical protein